ncbi:unnamed protein product [Hymenolepis diminuta]|uniref:Uncharacterized protein n=1 Tax=Hymenolepis diminuta TaxID=6216 RepID=A0A564Y3F4_HYMDI|nr:unnamed protein product [Hymenolepis diminuta]
MSNRTHRFLPFSITPSSHLKSTCTLMLSRSLTQKRTHVSYRLLRFLLISSLPQRAPTPFISLSLVSNSLWLP